MRFRQEIHKFINVHNWAMTGQEGRPVNQSKYKQGRWMLVCPKLFSRTLNENENSSLKVKYLTVNLTFDFERVILREGIALTKILRQNFLFTVYFRKSTEYVKTIWDLMSLGRNFGAIGWWHFLFDRPNFGWRPFLIPWRVFPFQPTLIRFSFGAFKMM